MKPLAWLSEAPETVSMRPNRKTGPFRRVPAGGIHAR